jgi:hypothetical protein
MEKEEIAERQAEKARQMSSGRYWNRRQGERLRLWMPPLCRA